MKYILPLILFVLFLNNSFAQNFVMTWQKCYGGTGDDKIKSMIPYKDGYLFFGFSNSMDGNVTINNCNGAAWLVNIDKNGEIIFDKAYCGFDIASGKKLISIDSGFYLTGATGPNHYGGNNGYWFARIDTSFNLIWQDVLGGSYIEDTRGACIAHDGGVIQYGITGSPDGDIEEYYGTFDNWLVKMNPDGSRDWVKTLGNVGAEEGSCLIPTSDGNYLYACVGENFLPGNTYCEGHDNRLSEGWIFKLNEEGEVLWHQCYGGSDIELFRGIVELEDGFIIAGKSHSSDIDLPENYGRSDIWVLRIDKDGNILWSKNYGGSKTEYYEKIIENEDNTFTIFCTTNSTDYDVQGNDSMIGGTQARVVWMIKIDENGNLIYQKPFSELSYLGGDCDFVKVSEYKYIAAVTRDALDNCNHTQYNQNEDIYIFEIQDMDEFIPSQPMGADRLCLKTIQKNYYSTELVLDTIETQWLLIPEEAGTLTQLHDSALIQWNQEFADTACLQVRAVNEYGESSYSETKEIIVYPPLEFANINGADSVCSANNHQSIYTTQIEDNDNINWYLEPETAGEIQNQQDTAIIIWNPTFEGTAHLKTAALNTCEEEEYTLPKEIQVKTCTGVEEQNTKILKFYPNPANTQITFELPQITKESILHIKDIYGKSIAQILLAKAQLKTQWDCSIISPGVYFYQTQINGEVYRGKIVVN